MRQISVIIDDTPDWVKITLLIGGIAIGGYFVVAGLIWGVKKLFGL